MLQTDGIACFLAPYRPHNGCAPFQASSYANFHNFPPSTVFTDAFTFLFTCCAKNPGQPEASRRPQAIMSTLGRRLLDDVMSFSAQGNSTGTSDGHETSSADFTMAFLCFSVFVGTVIRTLFKRIPKLARLPYTGELARFTAAIKLQTVASCAWMARGCNVVVVLTAVTYILQLCCLSLGWPSRPWPTKDTWASWASRSKVGGCICICITCPQGEWRRLQAFYCSKALHWPICFFQS